MHRVSLLLEEIVAHAPPCHVHGLAAEHVVVAAQDDGSTSSGREGERVREEKDERERGGRGRGERERERPRLFYREQDPSLRGDLKAFEAYSCV